MSEEINEKKFICIMCPLGCEVTVRSDERGNITEVLGNKCPKGEKYAADEYRMPMRILTSTVAIEGVKLSRLPVRTSGLVPRDRIFNCMRDIRNVRVRGPVKAGDAVIRNICGLGVDVVATRGLD